MIPFSLRQKMYISDRTVNNVQGTSVIFPIKKKIKIKNRFKKNTDFFSFAPLVFFETLKQGGGEGNAAGQGRGRGPDGAAPRAPRRRPNPPKIPQNPPGAVRGPAGCAERSRGLPTPAALGRQEAASKR